MAEVLLVDDELAIIAMMTAVMEEHNLQTDTATNGEQALNRICARTVENNLYDAIILDIAMPILDGWDVLHAVKNNPLWRHIDVVVLTGAATSDRDIARVTEYDGVFIEKKDGFANVAGELARRIISQCR